MTHATPAPRLSAIHVYPLKSAAGIALERVEVDRDGLRHDRRWLLVDADGVFLTQRAHPRMSALRTELDDPVLRITALGMAPLELPLAPPGEEELELVPVWKNDRYAASCGPDAAAWASAFMGFPCRVVRSLRPADREAVAPDDRIRSGFADAFAALVVSEASLDGLNARLPEPVTMARFRPNLVVAGVPAHDEDRWGRVRIGDVVVRGVRPCLRCALTTVDPDTGAKGKEPLRTLASYRRVEGGEVKFGMNVAVEGAGVLGVGDPVVPA